MKIKCYLLTLALYALILALSVRADEKWSWGQDKGNSREVTPRVSERRSSTVTTTVFSTRDIPHDTTTADSVEVVRTPATPQGRSFGFFKKFGCNLGLCKKDKHKYQGVEPVPLFPGPVPYAPPAAPLYPAPIAVGPSVPVISAVSKPIAISNPSGVYYPPQTQKPYPPIAPHPVKEEHHHHHTHIHEKVPGVHVESPYKHTGYPPKKTGFAPTIVHGGSSHLDSHEALRPTVGHVNPLPPVYPEAVTGTLYRPPKSLYQEECHCVLPHQCSPYDIVRKTVGKDIAYLVNPRNEASQVFSNDTSYTPPKRGKRDINVTNRQPVAVASHTPKGRAIGGYSPGLTGCGQNYVCCKSGVNQPKHFDNTCGRSLKSSIHGRIANKEYNKGATQFGEFPWQGAILRDQNYESVFVCGATLISPQHVITAAHCIEQEPVHALKIRLGDWDVNGEAEFYKHIELPVQKLIIHPKYYAGNLQNDIAVITLQGYIDFNVNPHISPVCLPNSYADFTHQHCYVSGWGKDAFGYSGEFQQILKKVDVPIVDRQTCQYALQQARLGSDYYLPEGFICAGGEEGKDTCKGDGGGPLVCPTSYNTFELAGIVSWGIGCGLRGVPGVYVNIPYYVDWLKSIIDYS